MTHSFRLCTILAFLKMAFCRLYDEYWAVNLESLGLDTLQRVPANKKPPCIRNRSQFSYKTMNKTIGYCSKTTGFTQKAVSYSREPAVSNTETSKPCIISKHNLVVHKFNILQL